MLYFSLAPLIIGVLVSFYLFAEWLKHGRRYAFPIFWSLGLIILYLFQIPAIVSNAGLKIVLTDFNSFFSLAFPIAFFSYLLIYLGILSATKPTTYRKLYKYLLLWFALALAFYAFYFAGDKIFESRAPLYASILLFFLPLHLLTLFALLKWYRKQAWTKAWLVKSGIMLMAAATLTGVFRSLFVFKGISLYPPHLWFIVLSSKTIFVAQTIGLLLLVVGFIFVHRNCFKDSGKDLC